MAVTSSAFTVTDALSARLATLQPGGWTTLNTNDFSDVWPTEHAATFGSPAKIIGAWGSMAWDSSRGDLIFWGGGHANYNGNEVYRWSAETLEWSRASLPSAVEPRPDGKAGAYQTVDGPDVSPISSHTYDNSEYFPVADRFVTLGGAAYNSGSGFVEIDDNGTPRRTGPYFWDPDKADADAVGGADGSHVNPFPGDGVVGAHMWENRNPDLLSGRPAGFINGATGYATENGKDVLYVHTGGMGDLWKYTVHNPADHRQDTWERVGLVWDGIAGPGSGAYSAEHNVFVRTSAGASGEWFTYWDLDDAGTDNVNINFKPYEPTGTFDLDGYWGMDYDSSRDQFVLWDGADEIWTLAPPDVVGQGEWTLTRAPTASGSPAPSLPSGVFTGIFGKWKYVESLDLFLGVANAETGTVWAYKPEQAAEPAPPPNPASLGLGTTEAEALTLMNYKIVNTSAASGGQMIQVEGEAGFGSAYGAFSGPGGVYTLSVTYFDENDGDGAINVTVNGTVVETWTLDQGTASAGATAATRFTHDVPVSLQTGDIVRLVGVSDTGEYARIDTVSIGEGDGGGEGGDGGGGGGGGTPLPQVTAGIEAEDMALTGYQVETVGAASGDAAVRLTGASTGTAAFEWAGESGTHDLTIGYFDENDGQSRYSVTVDGVQVASWTASANLPGNGASSATLTSRTLQGVDLDEGAEVVITGKRGGLEYARLDRVDVSDGTTPPPTTLPQTSGFIEAEDMALTGYQPETVPAASGGQAVRLPSGTGSGSASVAWAGADGTFDVIVSFFDENDGQSAFSLSVGGTTVASWTASENLPGAGASSATLTSRTIQDVSLSTGDVLTLEGAIGHLEYARLDSLNVVAPGSGPTPPDDDGPPPADDTRVEAEAMAMSGNYVTESNGTASGGALARLPSGSGQLAFTWTGGSGLYELVLGAFDENDGDSPVSVSVNGSQVAAVTLDQNPGGNAADGSTAVARMLGSVSLEAGDEVVISGSRDGWEYTRIDYLDLNPATA